MEASDAAIETSEEETSSESGSPDPGRPSSSACSCGDPECSGGCGEVRMDSIFALGRIGIHHVNTQSRLQFMHEIGNNPDINQHLIAYLKRKPWRASAVRWLLVQGEDVSVYAIQPAGPFAEQAYKLLIEFFDDQI